MTDLRPEVSVVICSVGRPDALELCIGGLRHVEDVTVEIIVVLGPGAETSVADLAARPEVATIVTSPRRNLSLSRNLGADAARGELIAFIDDDAYPAERWLADLVPAFEDPEVGAVGGETLDYTGRTHQAVTSVCSLAGDSKPLLVSPTPGLTETPTARTFYYPIGTNLVVRAEALRSIGGFDEQFDYFHDETDLARRLLDRGWIVRPLARGHVFHKFLPSAIRGERRIATDRRSIAVNRAYFAARHQAPVDGPDTVRSDFEAFADGQQAELAQAEEAGQIPAGTLGRFARDRAHATELLERWLATPPSPQRHVPDPASVIIDRPSVIGHPRTGVLHVGIVDPGGVATTPTRAMARRLADGGCRVHLVEGGVTHSTVDLEAGLWRHRIAPGPGVDVLAGDVFPLSALTDEVARTHAEISTLDVVIVAGARPDLLSPGLPAVVTLEDLESCSTTSALLERLRGHRPPES